MSVLNVWVRLSEYVQVCAENYKVLQPTIPVTKWEGCYLSLSDSRSDKVPNQDYPREFSPGILGFFQFAI